MILWNYCLTKQNTKCPKTWEKLVCILVVVSVSEEIHPWPLIENAISMADAVGNQLILELKWDFFFSEMFPSHLNSAIIVCPGGPFRVSVILKWHLTVKRKRVSDVFTWNIMTGISLVFWLVSTVGTAAKKKLCTSTFQDKEDKSLNWITTSELHLVSTTSHQIDSFFF